jgi:hypothetical protein
MKKQKFVGSNFTNQSQQQREYFVRVDKVNDVLSVRYFKIVPESEYENFTLADAMLPFDPSTVTLLRQLVHDFHYVMAEAVSSNAEAQGKVVREIGRQIFRPTLGENSIVGAGEQYDFPVFVLPFEMGDVVSEPYNHFVESVNVKGEVNRNGRLRGAKAVFLLSADVSTASLDDWTLTYIETPSFILEDCTSGEWVNAPAGFRAMSLLPTAELDAPASIAPDGTATITVTLKRDGVVVPYSGELVAEAVDGYAPIRRFNVVNGVGTFRVCALGLQVGEVMRIKVGTRVVTGLAAASIAVA